MDWQGIIRELLGPGAVPQTGTPLPGRQGQGGGLAELLGGAAGGGGTLGELLQRIRPPMGHAAGAAAAGGLLGSLLGGGRGGLLRVGGMAVVGLLAHRAYEQWKAQQGGGGAPGVEEFARPEAEATGGRPFGLALVQAMMAAARADGTMDAAERERIFAEAERLNLDPGEKAEMFRILEVSADPETVARLAETDAQKAELYTASALIIGEAGAAERAYLQALAGALDLPPGLVQRLEAELREAAALPGAA
ncbi:tellurite resistance TerB family protein [Sediminicoccus sp. BL-A-41-H5]|uniref:tellurite resistance TerB family protein n=1 Tax=Sediminicoccus sp. BL-A-41-H5 TaxID=3421106 RepID=UPI003D669963